MLGNRKDRFPPMFTNSKKECVVYLGTGCLHTGVVYPGRHPGVRSYGMRTRLTKVKRKARYGNGE